MELFPSSSRGANTARRHTCLVTMSLAMAAGTVISFPGPARAATVVACQAGYTGHVTVFANDPNPGVQNTDTVWTLSSQGAGSINVTVAPGTTPAVAALPCGSNGIFQVVWQGTDGNFWSTSATGAVDSGIPMAPGTSPSLVERIGGGWQAVFQNANGQLWTDGSNWGSAGMGVSMASGTSPSIAARSDGTFQAVWQGTDNDLFTNGPNGPVDLHVAMAPGTSPSLAELSDGSSAVAVQGADGDLWTAEIQRTAALTGVHDVISSVARPMDFATSPSITSVGNSYYAAYITQGGDVVAYPSGGIPVDLSQATGVSALGTSGPAIAYDNSGVGGYVVAFEDSSDAEREISGSFPATYSPPAQPGPTTISAPRAGIVSAPAITALPSDPSVG